MKFFIAFILSFSVNAQRFVVVDNSTRMPVSYATYSLFASDTIVSSGYSNENGLVVSNVSMAFDMAKVSCVGYESKELLKEKIYDTVFLSSKAILLDEVIVSRKTVKPREEQLLGLLNKPKKVSVSSSSKGFEEVLYIANTAHITAIVKSFLFRVKKRGKNKTAYRIHFYEKIAGRPEPGQEIILGNIIVYRDRNIGKLLEVDVSHYNLLLPVEGFFAGIEWLGIVDEQGNFVDFESDSDHDVIEFNDAEHKSFTFSRNRFRNEGWTDSSSIKNDFGELVKFKKWPNASFGIKILKE